MVTPFGSFHYHVVNINLHVYPYLVGNHDIHESLVGDTIILEAEGNGLVVVVAMIRHEHRLGRMIHSNLVVSRVGIHKAQHMITRELIDQAVNIR